MFNYVCRQCEKLGFRPNNNSSVTTFHDKHTHSQCRIHAVNFYKPFTKTYKTRRPICTFNTYLHGGCKFINLDSATHTATTVKSEIWSRHFSPVGQWRKSWGAGKDCPLQSFSWG